MKFKEYREDKVCWNSKLFLKVIEGKNLRNVSYVGAEFDEDTEYVLDDYEVTESDVNYGFDTHRLTLKK